MTVVNELDAWQNKHHPNDKLEVTAAIQNKTWPAEHEDIPPEIPVHTEMTEEELQAYIAQPPEHQEKVE